MKAKIFDVVLHNVPAGKSPATHLEDPINSFLKHYPGIQIIATHMNTLTVPAAAAAAGEESKSPSIVIFATLFYNS
jgi:hypothetical protein